MHPAIKFFMTIAFLAFTVHNCAQVSNKAGRKWEFNISAGLNSFTTSGIPASRNQLNVESLYADPSRPEYNQESRIAGLCYEFNLSRLVHKKLSLGCMLQFYRDDDEYISSSDQRMNSSKILEDSLSRLSIYNLQAYMNVGITSKYQAYESASGRHKVNGILAFGMAWNRTPDRTEFDMFEEDNFALADTVGGLIWRHTHTSFRHGIFVMPSLQYELILHNKNSVTATISVPLQWHSTAAQVAVKDRNSSGAMDPTPYFLKGTQIKIGYTF